VERIGCVRAFSLFILAPALVGTLLSAALICIAAPLVGAVILRICGVVGWSWLAPPVGLSALMLGAIPALHIPGRSTTVAVFLGVGVAAAVVAAVLPPPIGVLAAVPTGLLALVPFAANGHAGTLGVSFNNDMAFHLAMADAYRSASIARVLQIDPSYPLGPHALVAALAQGLGVGVDEAFAGFSVALLVLLAWTALAALKQAKWLGQIFVATVVGMPFLVAGYYGQGSFKEILQAILVLAFAITLQRWTEIPGRLRWLVPALLLAGVLSAYSWPGLAWPGAFFGIWLSGLAFEHAWRRRPPADAIARVRSEIFPFGLAVAILAVLLVPQAPRLIRFASATVGTNLTGVSTEGAGALGNLVAPLPFWEAFGVWDNPDYRVPPRDPFVTGMWTALIVAAVIVGAAWWLARNEWFIPAAAAASVAIWLYADHYQAPYVAAKALVIMTPLLMLVAARPIAEFNSSVWRPLWRIAGGAIVVVATLKLLGASWDSLRFAQVGPRDHLNELRELRPLLHRQPTLFLGNDDFIRWELAGVPVRAPVIGFQGMPTRPEKPWSYGQPFDFDSLDAATLNEFDWIITVRDAAGSAPPDGLRLEKRTRSFALWRRTAPIEARSVLSEGAEASAVLNCSTLVGRRLSRSRGIAAVRPPSRSIAVPPLPPGAVQDVRLRLDAGSWELQSPYGSEDPIEVTAPGLQATLPPNLDRPGPRWRIGRLTLSRAATITIRLAVDEPPLKPVEHGAYMNIILATRPDSVHVVPLQAACGQHVDWYRRSARSPG
jgi:hypothetical protein